MTFKTRIDGRGVHGEAIDVITSPPRRKQRGLGRHDLWFVISVR